MTLKRAKNGHDEEAENIAEWVYETAKKEYGVSFNRTYKVQADFRVYDTEGNVGIAYDKKDISIN